MTQVHRRALIWLGLVLAGPLREVCLNSQTLVQSGEMPVPANITDRFRQPNWSNGRLMHVDSNGTINPVVRLFDRTGIEQFPRTLEVPGAVSTFVRSAGRTPDGTIVLCGVASDAEGRRNGFISFMSSDGEKIKTLRTLPAMPSYLAVAPDGSVWMQVSQREARLSHRPDAGLSHGVIQHFGSSGKLLAEYIPEESLGDTYGVYEGAVGVSKDRFGWYANHLHVYFEILEDGSIKKYPGPLKDDEDRAIALAVLDNGTVLIGTFEQSGEVKRLLSLDREKSIWRQVTVPQNAYPNINGAEQNSIALPGAAPNSLLFFTVQPTAQQ